MYSCEQCDGMASDWHVAHLGSRASGGCGLVMTEAAAVEARGRISPQDLGIWSDDHIPGLRRVSDFIKSQGAVSAIQLAHAGRKAGTYRPWSKTRGFVPLEDGGWNDRIAPSPIAFREGAPVPQEITQADLQHVLQSFVSAAERANEAGFDVIELHSAHGYLLHQFLSPISNQRTDGYGGSFENRIRFHVELVRAVREVWPEEKPLFMRISATDWVEGGWDVRESVELCKVLAPLGLDFVDCSSGGSTPDAQIPTGPGYQVPLAAEIKSNSGMPTGAVGQITQPKQAEEIIASQSADLVFLGRELLRNPYWPQKAATELGTDLKWPDQYGWAVGIPS